MERARAACQGRAASGFVARRCPIAQPETDGKGCGPAGESVSTSARVIASAGINPFARDIIGLRKNPRNRPKHRAHVQREQSWVVSTGF